MNPSSSSSDKRLNWRQACNLLGIGKTKFYELVESGSLPARRVGKRGLYVMQSDVQRLIQPVSDDSQSYVR